MHTLTVEECEALSDNLPQRQVNFEWRGMHLRLHPWEHSLVEQPYAEKCYLNFEVAHASLTMTTPLYPNR